MHEQFCALFNIHTYSFQSATASVLINVRDINDNSPKFSERVYQSAVAEDAGYGTPVITVSTMQAPCKHHASTCKLHASFVYAKVFFGTSDLYLVIFIEIVLHIHPSSVTFSFHRSIPYPPFSAFLLIRSHPQLLTWSIISLFPTLLFLPIPTPLLSHPALSHTSTHHPSLFFHSY